MISGRVAWPATGRRHQPEERPRVQQAAGGGCWRAERRRRVYSAAARVWCRAAPGVGHFSDGVVDVVGHVQEGVDHGA